ncbi:SEN1 N terminal-domain-containing protein, partial [Lipomyces japonicus]|uniref:SEN1 N terminal-domain-containing protein n=1 Tax=Lipomyces japonicus TaxID=56871 RepID=UPI0034CD1557
MSSAPPSKTDEALKKVVALVQESHRHVDDSSLQERALQKSIRYLSGLPLKSHMFCHDTRRIPATEALQLFAFPQSEELSWLKKTLASHLKQCFHCVKAYEKTKLEMKKTMLDDMGYDRDNVDEFMHVLYQWDVDRIAGVLESAAETCRNAGDKKINAADISDSFNALYECLYSPNLLTMSGSLRSRFRDVFLGIQTGGRFLRLSQELVPAMITFMFDSDIEMYKWAEKSLHLLKKNVTEVDFNPCVNRAYHDDAVKPYIALGSTKIPPTVTKFWKAVHRVLATLSKQVILNYCCNVEQNIVKLFWNDLQAYPQCMPSMLPVFAILATTLGSEIWGVSSPFLPTSLTDLVLGINGLQFFKAALKTSSNPVDMLSWTLPYLSSLSGPDRLKCSSLVVSELLGDNNIARKDNLLMGFKVLDVVLDVDVECATSSNSIFHSTSSVNKLMRREARKVSEKYAKIIVESTTSQDSDIRQEARKTVRACVVVDCLSTVDEGLAMLADIIDAVSRKQRDITATVLQEAEAEAVDAESNSHDSTSLVCFGDEFWRLLKERAISDAELGAYLVSCIGGTKLYLAETLDEIKTANDAAFASAANSSPSITAKLVSMKIRKHQKTSQKIDQVLSTVSDVIQQLSDLSPSILRETYLTNQAIITSLLSCSLSPHSGLSRSSLEIIKQAHDATGRLEALRGLLSVSPDVLLTGYVTAITQASSSSGLTGMGTVPRLVRTTMDLVELMFDARTGYIASHNSVIPDPEVRSAARSFWKAIWAAMTHVYKRTLAWARAYPKEVMIDFMRDVLDLSTSLFANSQLLEQSLSTSSAAGTVADLTLSPQKPTDTGKDLLQTLADPLREMSSWLRLSDPALLQVAVKLVCDILKRFVQAKIMLGQDTFRKLEKLSQQTAHHYSNLSDSQCYDLMIAISAFDSLRLSELDIDDDELSIVTAKRLTGASISPTIKAEQKEPVSHKRQDGLDKWVQKGVPSLPVATVAKKPDNKYDQADVDEGLSVAAEMAKLERAKKLQAVTAAYKKIITEEKPLYKTSLVGSARMELSETRKLRAQAAAAAAAKKQVGGVIHPPRPPGFRIRDNTTDINGPPGRSSSDSAQISADEDSADDDDDDDDEEDDDDDDAEGLGGGLFALGRRTNQVPKTANAASLAPTPLRVSSTIAALRKRPLVPSSISEKERAERNMRARLRVNLDPLYHRILKWNYHSQSELPSDEIGSDLANYKPVSNKFNSAVEYKAVFEPLLMLEAVQSMTRSKEEKLNKPFRVTITNRVACDDYIDIFASIDNRVLQNQKLGDADLAVLTFCPADQEVLPGGILAGKNSQPLWPDKKYPSCISKIREIKRSSQPDLSDIVFRCLPNMEMSRNLLPRVELNGLRIMSMTTIEREYSSLQGLPYYDLCDSILEAKPAKNIRSETSKVRKAQATYKVNAPQAGAIIAAMESQGFTLIQGPPGTGKTKTILGIVGAALTMTKSRGIPISMPGQNRSSIAQPLPPPEPKRVLVCAPSNAAVDELVLRLKGGILNSSGEEFVPKIVRMGRSDIINPAVRDLTLEELVDREVTKFQEEAQRRQSSQVDRGALREQLNKVLDERAQVETQLNMTDNQAERENLRAKRDMLNAKKAALGQRLDEARDKHAVSVRTNEIERRNIQTKILTGADVICATLSGAGHDLLANLSMTFETVIIDEAAQCVELSALIPLKYGCTRCAMVGDPNQLPPTVLSQTASRFQYEQSLFVRMQTNFPSSVHLLSIQYRMHPDISKFPSAQFYDSRLIDGDGMAERTKAEWHAEKELFGPYRFFDVQSREQQSKTTHSYYNRAEAECAVRLYQELCARFPEIDFDGRVGIVTPYKQQLFELKNTFRTKLGQTGMAGIDFNTIDGFQGQEKEIIILSCVRSGGGGNGSGVGFLADVRRMNVALTRARSSLWIIGNVNSLISDTIWRKLITDAKERGMVHKLSQNGQLLILPQQQQQQAPPRKRANDGQVNRDNKKIHKPQDD